MRLGAYFPIKLTSFFAGEIADVRLDSYALDDEAVARLAKGEKVRDSKHVATRNEK